MARLVRMPVLIFLAMLLLSVFGAMAQAGSESEPPGSPIEPPPPGDSVQLPETEAIVQAHAEVVRQEEEREAELAAPAFQQERDASRYAYKDLSEEEAASLFRSTFGNVLNSLDADPARYITDAKLNRSLGDGDAVVTSEGKTALMEGSVPVETTNEQGELSKVDLSLEKTEEGFVPVNPLVEVNIGATAEEGVEVGSGGMTVTQAGAESTSVGQAFGEKNVFFSEVEEGSDTDLLVSPISTGIEFSDMLRSADSPETLRFPIEAPSGAHLRTVVGGGAEVLASDGTPLAMIGKPTAVDAQGTEVPVEIEVEGLSVVLHVEHREGDYAYPILVDPTVENLYQDWGWWYSGQHTESIKKAWAWNSSNSSTWLWPNYEDSSWPGWYGLFIYTSSGNLPANGWGQWSYSAPNSGTYLAKATINPFYRNNHTNCPQSQYAQPYDYDGMWENNQWNGGVPLFNQANNQGWSNLDFWGEALIIGMGTSGGISIPCWRDIGIGGVGIWLEDLQYPYINSVSGAPSGWLKKDNTPRTLSLSASDAGLGVRALRLIAPGGKESNWNKPICAGTYENRCPTAESGVITYETSQFPFEGETTMGLVVEDPTKKTWSQQLPIKMDGTAPKVTLSNQLATVTQEAGEKEKPQGEGQDKLKLPVYNLKVTAEDGSASELRSGVKEIKLYLDGSATPLKTKVEACSSGTCPRTVTFEYPVVLTGLTEGKHALEIEAVDYVGNSASRKERKIEFEYIPATGLKDEYVLQHFQLPDGHNYDEEPEYSGPEVAVNVMNGNVVFHERDFKVQTGRTALELERVYNSQLPSERDAQWGHGWSLAQTPELKAQSAGASSGTLQRSGAITNPVSLPESPSQPIYSKNLHAEVAKTSAGGYEVDYETAPEVSVFGSSGKIEETRMEAATAGLGGGSSEAPKSTAPTYVSSFGALGTGNGQFNHPGDVAIDPKGVLWVADVGNKRLQKFNQKGEFIGTFGSAGTGNGQFSSPKSIAFDAKGNMWVVDAGNNRLQEFGPAGEFVRTVGALGSGNGQFNGPEGIAIDPKGNLWVADTYNYRIQELNEKGEFIKVANLSGLGAIEPTGLDVGPKGYVWVADWAHNRVVELSGEGELVRQFGTAGTGNGQFQQPDAVAVDSRGNVWIGDQNNARVQEFNQNGEYVTKFGTAGSGAGQFKLGYPLGIAADSRGNLWVSDSLNNRVQRWEVPGYSPTYLKSFGSSGVANGQFAHPGDVAIDAEGNAWVVDENNNRVEIFDANGAFLAKFGSSGSGNGQFSRPTSLAISPQGNIWVADAGNCRLEEFDAGGEFLAKTGNCGSGNGQFGALEGVAIDQLGNIWVADTYRGRIQELNEKGQFIRVVGSPGSSAGQLCEPTGIDIGPEGNIWTTEWCNNRVSVFSPEGSFIRNFGAAGTGNGQFQHPDAVSLDSRGNVWIGDQSNQRVQEFNQNGEYITQFGSAGSGNGQFSFGYPMGIAADPGGRLLVTDTGNNRVQVFSAADVGASGGSSYAAAPAVKYTYNSGNLVGMAVTDKGTLGSDPAISVQVSSGLATGVDAEAAGKASFSYEATKLKSESDPEGETKYQYDASGRLNRIQLANGTYATITYNTNSQATAVTVDPAGSELARTTKFSYSTEPRRTIVWGGGRPEVTYDIGEDGSVVKWSYAEVPPTIEPLKGSLWGNRNSTTPVENKDQTLFVTGSSPHQVAKVQVVANGETVLEEKTCEDNAEPPDHHCEHVTMEWVTNPAEHAAGQLNLEVVVTDFLGHQASERFFVTMPQQPPPNPEAPPKPSFESIAKFREEFGLDREHNYSESEYTHLLLELLYEWELGEPAAVASVEKWGVPLRTPEIQELEYRERYIEQFAESISEWAEEHAPTTYGGYYVDNRAGGIIYLGFTSNQQSQVEAFKSVPGLIAPGQIREYPAPPTVALATVETTEESIANYLEANSTMNNATTEIGTEPGSSLIRVGSTNPSLVQEYLTAHFGAGANIQVFFTEQNNGPAFSKYTTNGPINPGSGLMTTPYSCEGGSSCWGVCTAGFSGRDVIENREGHNVYAEFMLTAGHCFDYLELANRDKSPEESPEDAKKLGLVRRYAWGSPGDRGVTDAEAVRIDPDVRSGNVFFGNSQTLLPIHGLTRARIGSTLCWFGVRGGLNCGAAKRLYFAHYDGRWTRQVEISGGDIEGDSGGPVWNPKSLKAVGSFTSWRETAAHPCHHWRGTKNKACWLGGITPLMPYANRANPFGALNVLHLELVRGDF